MKEHHDEVRPFVQKMAQAYRVLRDIPTDDKIDLEDEAIDLATVMTGPLFSKENSHNPKECEIAFNAIADIQRNRDVDREDNRVDNGQN